MSTCHSTRNFRLADAGEQIVQLSERVSRWPIFVYKKKDKPKRHSNGVKEIFNIKAICIVHVRVEKLKPEEWKLFKRRNKKKKVQNKKGKAIEMYYDL